MRLLTLDLVFGLAVFAGWLFVVAPALETSPSAGVVTGAVVAAATVMGFHASFQLRRARGGGRRATAVALWLVFTILLLGAGALLYPGWDALAGLTGGALGIVGATRASRRKERDRGSRAGPG